MDWEYIRPSSDYSVSLKISPSTPSTHFDKVRDPNYMTRVYWDMGVEYGDLWHFDNPTFRDAAEVKKLRFHVVGVRGNSLAWGKFAVRTNGGLYKGPQNTWCNVQNPGSEHYTLTSNPISGGTWLLDEIDNLQAGVYHYDSGIPSGVATTCYYISVIYQNASVRTMKPTAYTGISANLHGLITNTEGAFLDPYLASNSCIRTWFQWGETIAYGASTPVQYGVTGAFSAPISGLNHAKKYHYRAVVEVRADSRTDGWDAYYGQDMTIPTTSVIGHSIADKLVALHAI